MMKYIYPLKCKGDRYEKLLNKWKEAINILTTPGKFDEVLGENYDVRERDNKLEIDIFGFRVYLRFKHTFNEGVIQYFVKNADAHNEPIKILYNLRFDDLGNFKNEEHSMSLMSEFKMTNALILNELLDKLAKHNIIDAECLAENE